MSNRYDIPGDRYALFATFRGDASDGLPGVKGIGEKGASLIARHFASVDEVIRGAEELSSHLPAALAKKIIAGRDYLAIAPTVVRCVRDLPLPQISLDKPKRPKDMKLILSLQEQYGLGASVDRLISALQW